MMLSRKLRQWQQAAVIDRETAERIQAFEKGHSKPLFLQGLSGLGALTIGIGVISIVAANWAGIGYPWKLLAAGTLCLLLAAATLVADRRERRLTVETSVLVYYLLTLASIALLGQIYQSGTPAWQALGVWSLATAPLMLLARTSFGGALWFVGSSMTYALVAVAIIDALSSGHEADGAAVAIAFWPALAIAASKGSWLVAHRPRFARVFASSGWFLLLGMGALLPTLFYADIHTGDRLTWSLPVIAAVLIGLHVTLPRWYPDLSESARTGISLALGLGWLIFAAGTALRREEIEVLGAVLQVIYLGVLAWTCVQLERTFAFNLLTALIALRVLIIYFEVFGSMMSTGVGMISGGLLTLLMAWLWKRSKRSSQ